MWTIDGSSIAPSIEMSAAPVVIGRMDTPPPHAHSDVSRQQAVLTL